MYSNRQLFLQHLAQTSKNPLMLEIERAEGSWLITTEGRQILDLIAGIGVSALGHRHPKVIQAIENQLQCYLHTMVYGEFVLSPQVELATLLTQYLPSSLDSVYLVNSGAEATEGAMKLAKRYTKRTQIISMRNAYHGSTQGAMSLNSDPYFTEAYRPLLPDIEHIDFDCEASLQLITEKTAAVITETVQAEAGVRPPSVGYLRRLRERCTEVGALLVLDEIQVGMGRTGTLWAFEQYDIIPDILLLAKGLGGGMPIGAFIASQKMMQLFTENPILGHITTFGGHPVSAAAATATLRILTQTNIIKEVKSKEKLFLACLQHPRIQAVRSAGLLMGVELADFDTLWQVIQYCIQKGVLTDWFLFNNKTLRIAPPLTISEEEIIFACHVIIKALNE